MVSTEVSKTFRLGSNPNGATMKQCAIVLNGNDVLKVSNLKRKYNKIISHSDMKILEECELSELEDKYNMWKEKIKLDKEEHNTSTKLFTFINRKTGETIISIYSELGDYIKDKNDYIKIE